MSKNIEEVKGKYLQKSSFKSLKLYRDSISAYNLGLHDAINLNNDTPIFLDTNVLLRIYSISFAAREKLIKFFKDYKARIYITDQVQREFINNRENVINTFFVKVTEKIPQAFQQDILNKIEGFLTENKIVLKDYGTVETGLQTIKTECNRLFNILNTEVEEKKEDSKNIILKDEILNILSEANIINNLSEIDLKQIKKDYDVLTSNITKEEVSKELGKTGKAFPGLGDFKNKPDDPHGDFIIFHEIISFMEEKQTDAIFLTYDTTKGDWMQFNKLPHLHYIENVFANTGKSLFILDAERVFEDLLDMSFKSLIPNQEESLAEVLPYINEETLKYFLNTNQLTAGKTPPGKYLPIVKELNSNNYFYIADLENAINKVGKSIDNYNLENLGQAGTLRIILTIHDKNYIMVNKLGEHVVINVDELKKRH
jgi:hypothetical protein